MSSWKTGERLKELEQKLYEVSESTYGRELDTPEAERKEQVREELDGYAHRVEDMSSYAVRFSLAPVLGEAHKLGLDPQRGDLREVAEDEYESMQERLEYQEEHGHDPDAERNLRLGMAVLAREFNLSEDKVKKPVRELIERDLGPDYRDPSVGQVREAAKLAQEFDMGDEYDARELAERAYTRKLENAEDESQRSDRMETYLQAEEIADEFDLGEEKERTAVKQGLLQLAQPGRYTYTINNVHSRSGQELVDDMVEKGKEYGLLFDNDVQNAAKQTVTDIRDRVQAGQYKRHQLKNAVFVGETFGVANETGLDTIKEEFVRHWIDEDGWDSGEAPRQAREIGLPSSKVEELAVDAARDYLTNGQKDEAKEVLEEFLALNLPDMFGDIIEGPQDEA